MPANFSHTQLPKLNLKASDEHCGIISKQLQTIN